MRRGIPIPSNNIMQKYKYPTFLFSSFILVASFCLSIISISNAQAIKTLIKYPISELGNCQDKNDCKQYCSVSAHYLVCTDFGEKNSLISQDEAARTKKLVDVLKSDGPGGCKNEAACKKYCNKTENQKECFIFSMKNGLISKEKLKEIEDGIVKMRSGLKQLPPEMKTCIINKVGTVAFNKIESGDGEAIDLVEIGGAVQNCALNYGGGFQQKLDEGLKQAPPEAQNCFKLILEKAKRGELKGGEDMPSIMRGCLPAGTKIPSAGEINMDALKKVQEYYRR